MPLAVTCLPSARLADGAGGLPPLPPLPGSPPLPPLPGSPPLPPLPPLVAGVTVSVALPLGVLPPPLLTITEIVALLSVAATVGAVMKYGTVVIATGLPF